MCKKETVEVNINALKGELNVNNDTISFYQGFFVYFNPGKESQENALITSEKEKKSLIEINIVVVFFKSRPSDYNTLLDMATLLYSVKNPGVIKTVQHCAFIDY